MLLKDLRCSKTILLTPEPDVDIEHLTAVLGETVTISCNYPEKFKSKPKCLAKRFDDSHTIVVSTTEAPKGRFSISDDRRSNTISVNIINVTQEDSGDYSCKVMKGNTLRWIYLEIIGEMLVVTGELYTIAQCLLNKDVLSQKFFSLIHRKYFSLQPKVC
uniref:Ig-like domain-containing protein n=1 Tax=Pygocentrus nattereri TaxID=42514 RepID=A0A3B4CTQ3_PYGNA